MKKLTRKQERLVENYETILGYYGLRDVRDVYNKPSTAKTRAEYLIKSEMHDINKVTNLFASDYTVIGHNCNMYSCAYTVYDWKIACKSEMTKRAIVYYTAYNRYIIPFDDTIEQELEEVFSK